MKRHVWFWMETPSPHLTALLSALIERGVEVHVIAASENPGAERRQLGWPDTYAGAPTTIVERTADVGELLGTAPAGTVHIVSRLDFYSISGRVRRAMKASGHKHWALMETIDDSGFSGRLKRLRHRMLIRYLGDALSGALAIGGTTRSWLVDRGADPAKVFSFAYFADQPSLEVAMRPPFLKFCYVGQLIRRKRVDLLIEAFAKAGIDAELEIIGVGPEEAALRDLAQKLAPRRVHFHPPIAFADVPRRIAAADFFVLPSRFDGWGAVVVEALMVGTPVLCSDRCGSSAAVSASGVGDVFRHDDVADLQRSIRAAALEGRITELQRAEIIAWASAFSGAAGADYLIEILFGQLSGEDAVPPWRRPRLASQTAALAS